MEAVSRFVRDGVDVVSAVEAAESAGLSPRKFLDRLASRRDAPAPLFRQNHRVLWERQALEAYLRAWKQEGTP